MENSDILYAYNQRLHRERIFMGRIAAVITMIVAPLFYLKDITMTQYLYSTFYWRLLPVLTSALFMLLTFTKYKGHAKVTLFAYMTMIYGVLIMMMGVFWTNYNTADGRFDAFLIAGFITTILIIQMFSSPVRRQIAHFPGVVILFFLLSFLVLGGDAFAVSNMVNPILIIIISSILSVLAERRSFSEFKAKFLLELNERTLRNEVEYRKTLEAQLKNDALNDALTKTYNKRAAESLLPDKIKVLNAGEKPYALVYIDLDNLKTINDTYGHDYGDVYITTFTKTAQDCLKDHVAIYRIGGDEFLILLEDVTRDQAVLIINEISQRCISDNVFFSYGISISGDHYKTDLTHLIREADIKMYNQKKKKQRPD